VEINAANYTHLKMHTPDKLNSPAQDVDNIPDFFRQGMYDNWRFRPAIAGRSGDVSYGYYKGCLMLELHVELRRTNGEPCNFCALVQPLSREIHNRLSATGGQFEIELPFANLGQNHAKQSVFIKIVEIAEQGQQGREGWVPSIVWLQSLDFCLHGKAQGLKAPDLLRESIVAVGDGKLQTPVLRGRVLSGLSDSSGVDEMIQGGPKIVNAVADNARPLIQSGLDSDFFKDHAIAGTISIDLLADDVRVAINPSLQFSVESIGMFPRSPELDPATSKLRSEHTLILRC
jgi:hypothetical protein